MLKPGDFVGPYEIRGFVGQGGMGQVYRAFDPRLERIVALKVMVVPASPASSPSDASGGPAGGDRDSSALTGELSARLLREARAVASLNHPNVVAIFDVGESNGRLYLAMELVVGSTLRALAAAETSLGRKLRWLVEIARALDAAHRVGLIHRDVKPENVMIRDDGSVKVLDFGIARRTVAAAGADAHSADTITGGGAIAGTPVYMAPEQIKGRDVDARCDQFAWGVTAYEVIGGRRPWSDSDDVLQTVAKVLTDPAPPLGGDVEGLPAAVEQVVHRALSKDPGARFATMAEIAEALEPFATPAGAAAGHARPSDAHGERVRVTPLAGNAAVVTPRHGEGARGSASGEAADLSDPSVAYAATTRVPTSVSVAPPDAGSPSSRAGDRRRRERRPRSRALRLAVPVGLLAMLAVATFAVVRRRHVVARPGVGGLAPRPLSTVPEAETAYRAAMSQWRDGAATKARATLQRAIDLDPTFSAAYLELALQTPIGDTVGAKAAYESAFENRHFLTKRDARLLTASEPYVREHPDVLEWETRMAAAVFEFKRDPELQYYLGRAREKEGDDQGAEVAYEAALRLDDGFVPAFAALGNVQRNLGRTSDALDTTARCIEKSRLAAACVETRYELSLEGGECHRAREEAQRWREIEPTSPQAFAAFARGLQADGAPRPSVEEALAHRWSLLAPAQRTRGELWDRLYLAIFDGDLARADELAQKYDAALAPDADAWDHAEPVKVRTSLLMELGRMADAAAVAKDYLDRKEAWKVYAFAPDPSLTVFEAVYRGGKATRAELDATREAWLEKERARLRSSSDVGRAQPVLDGWITWLYAWGDLVETREEAAEARAHMPKGEPLPSGSHRSLRLDYAVGRTYALTGQADQAIEHLTRVTGACATFDDSMLVLRARDELGVAYEAKGDAARAREAYEKVVATWPKTPESRTVRHASERLKALPAK
jgi:serine/threonine-protein kinase